MLNNTPCVKGAGASKKVLVALSGGVDSTVCVHLLKEQGYEVAGLVMKMSPAHDSTIEAAKESADSLSIPLYVRNLTEDFQKKVIDYFAEEYMQGRTPNPCVVCNPLVKFKTLVDVADELGYDLVATGHYARLEWQGDKVILKRGASLKRDQSYMLYRLDQRVLTRLLLPLSELEKDEVRRIAAALGVTAASKPDSQENCFIPDNDYAGYIERHYGKSKVGQFFSPEGKPCGAHSGILHYTVGQRKGLGIALGRPVFIREIDPVTGNIFLADSGQEYFSEISLSDVTSISGEPLIEGEIQVKIRSAATPCNGRLSVQGECVKVLFESPQRATAKGQSAVLYDGENVLGGGFIADCRLSSCQ